MSAVSLYTPYRAIGLVTDGTPFHVSQLGTESFVTLSLTHSFHVLKADRLTTCLVSEQVPATASSTHSPTPAITCLQPLGHETYVGVGSDILVYYRTRVVRTYASLSGGSAVQGMVSVGKVLFAYYLNNFVQIIDTKARSVVGSIELLEESPISCLVHPATYLNKVLVGYESGSMELWNFRRKSLVHVFTCHTRYFEAKRAQDSTDIFGNVVENLPEGNYIPAITCIEQSPACDVVAVGFSSGDIILINLKFDEILFTFKQSGKGSAGNGPSSDHGGAVCSLSFRTDSAAEKFPYLVSGSDDGRLYVWYLGTGDNDDEDDEEEKEEKEPRKLMLTIDDAHSGRIGKVHFMYGEPILITSSEDNSLKTWIFDSPDGSARLLRSREGHSQGGPHRIRFYGGTTNVSMRDNADGYSCEMLSAGADGAFRLFNFAVESQNREMSQKPILKKLGLNRRNERLPEMTGFDFCETRQRDWADIVSIHKNHSNTYLWRLKNRVITETILRQPSWKTNEMNHAPDRSTHSSAVTLTSCGHFCIVGSKGGTIYVYNVQSGHPRGSYPMDASGPLMTAGKTATRLKQPGNVLHEKNKILGITENEKTGQTWKAGSLSQQNETDSAESKLTSIVEEAECIGHTGEVTGLFVDTTMSILVSSGLDGKLIFWDFNSHKILGVADNSSPILKMEGFRDGNFVAVVSQDRLVRVYDMTSQKLCRRFDGHSREVTDVAFSPDGRRLLTCSMDCTVRVWDMATARCLSWLKFDEAVVSMCLSLSGEYLCLTFTEKDGIYMYIDRSLYETVHFWKEPTEPTTIDACRVVSDVAESPALIEDGQDDLSLVVSVQAQVDQGMAKETVEQRGDGTITMSAIPKAYWTCLLNLEAIKLRNKPKSAPVAPPLAPFFLPTVVKAGESAPSFPTPAEYKKLTAEMNNNEKSSNDTVLGKRDASSVVDEKVENGTSVETNEVDDFKHMSSAWSDDGNEGGFGDDNEDAFGDIEEDVVVDVVPDSRKQSTSRIIRRRTELPRCKLVAYIEMNSSKGTAYAESPIVGYLKSIGPPAVDAEMRALCRDAQDEVGVQLLGDILSWLMEDLKTCENFEVLQAYLYRFLFIYSEVILECPELHSRLQKVKSVHENSCKKFRHLVQSNLCVLKMMAQIPSL